MRAPALVLSCILLTAAVAGGGLVLGAEPPPPPRGLGPLETSCVTCHKELDGEPTQHIDTDIHFASGLTCNNCHGGNPAAGFDGDPEAAHDVSMGWRRPTRLQIPDFCGKCHADAACMKKYNPQTRTDQLSEYRTSVHGQRNAAGDERTAICIDCHGAHGIVKVSDPRSTVYPLKVADTCAHCHADEELMQAYGIKANQFAEYKTSVHAHALYDKGDTSAPTCNDCHGSHGAVPPGVQNVANVCGSCHNREATLFREVEAKKKLNLEPCIRCVICHGNHAVLEPTQEMIGVGPESTCTSCHDAGEPGYVAAEKMGKDLARLRRDLAEATRVLDEAEAAGVEVGPDRFALQKSTDSLVEARVLVHSFDLERFNGVSSEGIKAAEDGVAAGRRAFAELRYRRMGLGLSLVVIVSVIIALALTVKRIEK